jgi:hypothetical protein
MEMLKQGLALLLKRRDFGLLMSTQYLAQAGDGIVQTALATVIVFGGQRGFDLEGARSPEDILRIALYIYIPYTILSPFTGVVIDRWDRRRLLFVANGFRAAVIALVALAGPQRLGGAPLYLAFLLTLTSTRVVLATKAAALPATLDGRYLVEANGVSQLGGALFQLAGAGFALLLRKLLLPVGPIVLTGAIVYGVGASTALAVRRAGEPRASPSLTREMARIIRRIAEGVREVSRTPKAGASITTYFWLRCLWSLALIGIGLEARQLLAGNHLKIALVTGGAGAFGAILGFLVANRLLDRVRTTAHLVLTASTIGGAAVAALGPLDHKAALALLTFGLGFGFFLAKISLDTMVQEALGDDFRGRAFSLYDIAYNLAWVGAAGAMKLFYTPSGIGDLVAASGIVFLVGMAGLASWFKRAGLLSVQRVRVVVR